ncbi:MAG: PrsW family intramembrane metalloprotease [Chloroflexi bacterium]|nr:PrsW family intramembrane metalloprotease [Chloroflexota bacterium]
MTAINSTQTRAAKTHWPSMFQFGLSLFGALGLWVIALLYLLSSLIQFLNPGINTGLTIASASNALGIFLLGILLLPSAGFALLRLIGRSELSKLIIDQTNRFIRPGWLILLLPIVLLIGFWVAGGDNFALTLIPPLFVLGAALPVLWLIWLGKRGLPAGSPQRQWGLFAVALTIGPFIMLVLEILVFIAIFVIAIFAFPALFAQIYQILPADLDTLSTNPTIIDELISLLVSEPGIITLLMLLLSGFVPLIEELFKPLAVWLLARRKLTPVEGFTAGLISGSAYALFETLTRAPESDSWVLFVVVRIGTAVMHIFTTGLMGWAIASAFTEKRYLRLVAVYFLAVIIHGLWNAAPVLLGIAFITITLDTGLSFPSHLIITAPIFLLYLTLAAFTLIVYINRRFNRAQETALAASKESA